MPSNFDLWLILEQCTWDRFRRSIPHAHIRFDPCHLRNPNLPSKNLNTDPTFSTCDISRTFRPIWIKKHKIDLHVRNTSSEPVSTALCQPYTSSKLCTKMTSFLTLKVANFCTTTCWRAGPDSGPHTFNNPVKIFNSRPPWGRRYVRNDRYRQQLSYPGTTNDFY